MAVYEQHFTVEEARAWLPRLRKKFSQVRDVYAEMEPLQADFERALARIRQNGSAPPAEFPAKVLQLQDLMRDVVEAGIEVKDILRGLVDFPHWREGEEVLLCWQMGEDDLRFWHRVEDGYAGRVPL